MNEPKRIQRKRTKGWRMPEGAVYVGRPTKWGNPCRKGDWCIGEQERQSAAGAVAVFRKQATILHDRAAMEELRGKDLACWCPLSKSIMDAAWSILLSQVRYKAESAGVYAVAVNPRGTSQTCSGCGRTVPKNLSQRTHDCPHCGLVLGRDHNAGRNILALGLSAVGLSGLQNVHGR